MRHLALTGVFLLLAEPGVAATATGRVFVDENRNGRLDASEAGVPNQ